MERLNNDRDLEDVRSKALALVQACLQARSNRSTDRRAGVNAPAPGQVPGLVSSRPHELGIADTAQVSQLVSQWEKDLFGACIQWRHRCKPHLCWGIHTSMPKWRTHPGRCFAIRPMEAMRGLSMRC